MISVHLKKKYIIKFAFGQCSNRCTLDRFRQFQTMFSQHVRHYNNDSEMIFIIFPYDQGTIMKYIWMMKMTQMIWWNKHLVAFLVKLHEPCSKCLTSWHQIRKCLRHCLRLAYARTGFAYAHISCLTRSLRWLTRTIVLLTPHPYKGPLA